jgi:hypothetical protein
MVNALQPKYCSPVSIGRQSLKILTSMWSSVISAKELEEWQGEMRCLWQLCRRSRYLTARELILLVYFHPLSPMNIYWWEWTMFQNG